MLAGDDAAAVARARALLDTVPAALTERLEQNPASLAQFRFLSSGIGVGRWADGNIITVSSAGGAELLELSDNQSLHFIYGQTPATLPTTGTASYDFASGTVSTADNGTSIGRGVTSGSIVVDFGAALAAVEMQVQHTSNYSAEASELIDYYSVEGLLNFDFVPNSNVFIGLLSATAYSAEDNPVSVAGSACNPVCSVEARGGFFGPDAVSAPSWA